MSNFGRTRPPARRLALAVLATLVLGACGSGTSGFDDKRTSWLLQWNRIAIDASGFDHANALEQAGPGKAARAMAIVHLAMFDAANGIAPAYQSYLPHVATPAANASMKAAVGQAAHDTLVALYPSQAGRLETELAQSLLQISDVAARDAGVAYGQAIAADILANRANDGAEKSTDDAEYAYPFSDEVGRWRSDPLNPGQPALGRHWSEVAPFAIQHAAQFRVPPPPALTSAEYARAFDEVRRLGGDGVVTPTERGPEQTQIGIYWAYDGTPSLCAPPRMYNQIAVQIARQRGSDDPVELARLLALVNVAMADASVAIWESKYFYDFWRPVTGIREADAGTGPSGAGDGNPLTIGDRDFTPLGAPASNLSANDFTPPFPTYPSGHAGFGGALFQVLRNVYGTDAIAFTFVSDEFNGVTADNTGTVRPLLPRSFRSLSEAEEENAQSRIYLGIHWDFDKRSIAQGNRVADYVFDTVLRPL